MSNFPIERVRPKPLSKRENSVSRSFPNAEWRWNLTPMPDPGDFSQGRIISDTFIYIHHGNNDVSHEGKIIPYIDITVSPEDNVKLVMDQTKCSEEIAIKTLEKWEGDIVEAILELNITGK
jgi:hypothetical protein